MALTLVLTVLTADASAFDSLLDRAIDLVSPKPVEVSVTGLQGDALQNALKALSIPPGMVRDGVVDEFWLERFATGAEDAVKTSLEPFGYYGVSVNATLENPRQDNYRLKVSVDPGEPVRLAKVNVGLHGQGSEENNLRQLTESFPLRTGSILLHAEYERAKGELLLLARDSGYLDADFSEHAILVYPERLTADLNLTLDTGNKYYFGKILFEGASNYPSSLPGKYLTIKPGEVFSFQGMGKTHINLAESGYFKEVEIIPQKEDASDNRIPLLIRLTPVMRRSLRLGAGYGTDTGARVSMSYKDVNMFELGHILNIDATVAQLFRGIGANYLIPSENDLETMTEFKANLQQEEPETYKSSLLSLEGSRGYLLPEAGLLSIYAKLLLEEYTIGLENSKARLLMPGIRLLRTSFDDIIRPKKGFQYGLDVRGTHKVLGSTAGFIQLVAQGGAVFPLPLRFSLFTRAMTGLSWLSDPLSDLPASVRFFAGGDQSVRGYAYKSLGPTDASGDVVGGKYLLQGSVELEKAVFDNWGVSVFYDLGNAFNTFTNLTLYQGVGAGVRYYSKAGAITLGVARQVDEDKYRLYFNVGFQL